MVVPKKLHSVIIGAKVYDNKILPVYLSYYIMKCHIIIIIKLIIKLLKYPGVFSIRFS
jgi:hypothetical protein